MLEEGGRRHQPDAAGFAGIDAPQIDRQLNRPGMIAPQVSSFTHSHHLVERIFAQTVNGQYVVSRSISHNH